jgi:hypothetical protein
LVQAVLRVLLALAQMDRTDQVLYLVLLLLQAEAVAVTAAQLMLVDQVVVVKH